MKRGELKQQVLHCLENYPKTRESDVNLTIVLWLTFYGQYVNCGKVSLTDMQYLPQQDHIGRMRRKIQEKRLDLSTKNSRKHKEMEWRNWATLDKCHP